MRRVRGFTLLEILVAIAIFALMYVMAHQFFNRILNSRNLLDAKAVTLTAQQRALLFMVQDFDQIIARPVRDKLGSREPALIGNESGVAFTRLGWANPYSLQHRSNEQRVRYGLHDHKLVRRYWPVLDPNVGTRPVDDVILKNVKSVKFRYLTRDADTKDWHWLDRWPSNKMLQTPALLQPLPDSVEVSIQLENGDKIHRYFRLVINPWVSQS